MPHVIIELHSGGSEQQKARLAEAVTKAVMAALSSGEDAVSVAIEEVEPQQWAEEVYKPDILRKPRTLYKKPGYAM